MRFQFSGGIWRDGSASVAARYSIALLFFAAALAARVMLIGTLPAKGFPFLSFFPAVLLTAYLVGFGPGLLVGGLSICSAWVFFMGAGISFWDMQQSDVIALVFFTSILIVDCIVIERMNIAMRSLRLTSEKLRSSENELVARQAELSDANRQKDVFLAILAHELRNPLAPILAAARLIGTGRASPDQTARAAEIITRQSLQLTRLVDDLLDASRIHSGKLALQKASMDLRDVVSSALETCKPLSARSAGRFTVELADQPVPVWVDGTRVAQCISNLLHNAFKFTPDDGAISLRMQMLPDDQVLVSIADTGRGISAKMLPRLFEMFTQEGASGKDGNSGLGIGLALTYDLVQRHGGTLSAHSDGKGKGARFDLVLPLTDKAPVAGTASPSAQEDAGIAGTTNVLVVDDNVDAAESLQELLELSGFRVATAHTGHDALTMLAKQRYQAVLLDIGLPDMSGYDVATAARLEGLVHDDTRLIALTGWSDEEARRRSAEAGIHRHLNKPVQLDDLMALLRATDPAPAA